MQDLIKALISAQKEFPDFHRSANVSVTTKKGGKYSYNYLTLAELLGKIKPILLNHGLVFTQSVSFEGDKLIKVGTTLYHELGTELSFETLLPVPSMMDNVSKDVGSAFTYGKRYALTAIFGIEPDNDTDATYEKVKKKAPPPKKNKIEIMKTRIAQMITDPLFNEADRKSMLDALEGCKKEDDYKNLGTSIKGVLTKKAGK